MATSQQPPEYPPGSNWPRDRTTLAESFVEDDGRLVIVDPGNAKAWVASTTYREWVEPDPANGS